MRVRCLSAFWLAPALVLALAACSGGAASSRPDEPEPTAVSATGASVLPLVAAWQGWDGPVESLLYWGPVPDEPALTEAFDVLPDDPWGTCDPAIEELPAELQTLLGAQAPGPTAWLAHPEGACQMTIGEPALLIGQSGFFCDVAVAFRLEPSSSCGPLATDTALAPVAVVAETVRPDLRWVAAELVTPELADGGLGTARIAYDGVSSELPLALPDWQRDEAEAWLERLSGEEPDVSLHRLALVERVATSREAVENRWVSWFVLAGDDPAAVDCSCHSWETGEPIDGCVDDYTEFVQSQVGLVQDGEITFFEPRWDYLRGALVEGDTIAVLVTGYKSGVGLHRRLGPSEIQWTELVYPVPAHEEDSEPTPVTRAPYCGP